ncbi:MAG: hypothetical protein Q8927_14045 [Bacteroidota bacterium]|nr:hypothetical protein [Bacteroidota bacterium]MDP4217319.1 hypothetical protein [Bacteroidota bacterium]MDP4247347.1 hypothetical protein [Bacteroidota bacterium]MDP4253915.1 hypothetical protein [Bacteroidota bacterium]MDP4257278.1 hypothetical protein [Bacteroidota bacterium]
MDTYTDQKRHVRIVLAILLISMFLDKYLVSAAAPGFGALLGITPLFVFLDIPADLPFTFGILPVLLFFALLYAGWSYPYQARQKTRAREWLRRRIRAIVGAILIIPLTVLAGGLAYIPLHDHLPKHVRNAIESFGINLDLHTPIPGYEVIHLRGSMVMFCCLLLGGRICIRRIRGMAPYLEVPVQERTIRRAPEHAAVREHAEARGRTEGRERAAIDAA